MCLLIITLFSACKNPLVNVFTKMYFFLQPVLLLLIISFTGTGTGSSRVDEFRKLVFYISSFRNL